MKKIALILLGLIMMSTAAFAYTTVVTLTITNISDNGTPVNSITLETYGHTCVNCKVGISNIKSTRINTVNVNDSYSFLCDLTSGTSYNFMISGNVSSSTSTTWTSIDGTGTDLWLFPFVAD